MGIYQKGGNWYIDYYVKGHRKRKKIVPSKKDAELSLKNVQVKNAREEYLGRFEENKIPFDVQKAMMRLDSAWTPGKTRQHIKCRRCLLQLKAPLAQPGRATDS